MHQPEKRADAMVTIRSYPMDGNFSCSDVLCTLDAVGLLPFGIDDGLGFLPSVQLPFKYTNWRLLHQGMHIPKQTMIPHRAYVVQQLVGMKIPCKVRFCETTLGS